MLALLLLPSVNPDALRPLFADAVQHRLRAEDAIRAGRAGDLGFLAGDLPPHLKLYAALGSLLAQVTSVPAATSLAIGLVNALCGVGTLVLLRAIAVACHGPAAAAAALAPILLCPSLLLHHAVPLRDALFLLTLLGALRCSVAVAGEVLTAPRGLLCGALGLCLTLLAWRVRAELAPLLILSTATGAVLALVRAVRGQASVGGNLGAALLLGGALCFSLLPDDACRFRVPPPDLAALPVGAPRPVLCPPNSLLTSTDRVRWLRHKFLGKYPAARTTIDPDVDLRSPGEALRYLPRALGIGLFAPFPWQWPRLRPLPLRLLCSGEMLVLYGLQAAAFAGLLRRRRAVTGPLWVFFLGSAVALGLVVANAGALYRLRYGALLCVAVLAAGPLALPFAALVRRCRL